MLLIPGHSDVAISAQKPSMFGADIIGGGVADCLSYPKNAEGEPDLDALAGAEFQQVLEAAIDEKIAVIEAARA